MSSLDAYSWMNWERSLEVTFSSGPTEFKYDLITAPNFSKVPEEQDIFNSVSDDGVDHRYENAGVKRSLIVVIRSGHHSTTFFKYPSDDKNPSLLDIGDPVMACFKDDKTASGFCVIWFFSSTWFNFERRAKSSLQAAVFTLLNSNCGYQIYDYNRSLFW